MKRIYVQDRYWSEDALEQWTFSDKPGEHQFEGDYFDEDKLEISDEDYEHYVRVRDEFVKAYKAWDVVRDKISDALFRQSLEVLEEKRNRIKKFKVISG